MIKECGGRAIDLGFVIDYWTDGYIHPILCSSLENKLELRLTNRGKEFLESI